MIMMFTLCFLDPQSLEKFMTGDRPIILRIIQEAAVQVSVHVTSQSERGVGRYDGLRSCTEEDTLIWMCSLFSYLIVFAFIPSSYGFLILSPDWLVITGTIAAVGVILLVCVAFAKRKRYDFLSFLFCFLK